MVSKKFSIQDDMIQIDVVYKVIIIQHAFVADKVILA